MSKETCTVCGRVLADLPEDGCPDCGLEYDPLAPDETKPLDFNKEVQTEYIPEEEDYYDIV